MVADMDELEEKHRALIERISGYPMSEAARARILAEVEASYRRDRAGRSHDRRKTLGGGSRQGGSPNRWPVK